MKIELTKASEEGIKKGVSFPRVCCFAFALSLLGGLYHSTSSVKFTLILSTSISSVLFSALTLLTAHSISPAASVNLCGCM